MLHHLFLKISATNTWDYSIPHIPQPRNILDFIKIFSEVSGFLNSFETLAGREYISKLFVFSWRLVFAYVPESADIL